MPLRPHVLLVAALLSAAPAFADTIGTVTADIPNYCLQSNATSAACTATNGNTSATASASVSSSGDIVTAVTASASSLYSSLTTATVSPQGSASGSISDLLTIAAPGLTTGYVKISSDLAGSYNLVCSGGGSGGDCAYDIAILDTGTWAGNALPFLNLTSGDGLGSDFLTPQNPTWTETLTSGQGFASTNTFLEPVVFGDSYDFSYSLEIYADVNCSEADCPLGGNASVTGSFSDPPVIQVLDANKNPVADATVQSSDGIIYSPAAASPTPEPSSLVLLSTGLLGAAALARRRSILHRHSAPSPNSVY